MSTGLVFECHLNTKQSNHLKAKQMASILKVSNCWDSSYCYSPDNLIITHKCLVLECFRFSNVWCSDPHCIGSSPIKNYYTGEPNNGISVFKWQTTVHLSNGLVLKGHLKTVLFVKYLSTKFAKLCLIFPKLKDIYNCLHFWTIQILYSKICGF